METCNDATINKLFPAFSLLNGVGVSVYSSHVLLNIQVDLVSYTYNWRRVRQRRIYLLCHKMRQMNCLWVSFSITQWKISEKDANMLKHEHSLETLLAHWFQRVITGFSQKKKAKICSYRACVITETQFKKRKRSETDCTLMKGYKLTSEVQKRRTWEYKCCLDDMRHFIHHMILSSLERFCVHSLISWLAFPRSEQ